MTDVGRSDQGKKHSIGDFSSRFAKENDADIIFINSDIDHPLDIRILRLLKSRKLRRNAFVILVTPGGNADVAFRISRYFQDFYESFTAVVPGWCKSAGTLFTIGANNILIGDLGELGPLDVQLATRDELTGRSSGLADDAALRTLQQAGFNIFEEFLLDITQRSSGRVTFKTAAEISATITVGLLEPIFAQFDPQSLGSNYRSTRVAEEYASRLDIRAQNILDDFGGSPIERLVRGYPSHSFVIDRAEAGSLFRRVSPIEGDLLAIVDLLAASAVMAVGSIRDDTQIIEFLTPGTDDESTGPKRDGAAAAKTPPTAGQASPDGGAGSRRVQKPATEVSGDLPSKTPAGVGPKTPI